MLDAFVDEVNGETLFAPVLDCYVAELVDLPHVTLVVQLAEAGVIAQLHVVG